MWISGRARAHPPASGDCWIYRRSDGAIHEARAERVSGERAPHLSLTAGNSVLPSYHTGRQSELVCARDLSLEAD